MKHINRYFTVLLLTLFALLTACTSKTQSEQIISETATPVSQEEVVKSDEETWIIGTWVYDLKNEKYPFEGIAIEEGGSAKSINQSEIVYEQWRMGNGAITLSTYIAAEEKRSKTTYQIVTLTSDSLVLDDRKGKILTYYKLGE